MKSDYCVQCKQKLSKNFFVNLVTRVKLYEFQDGNYCENCAKAIVSLRRRSYKG